MQTVKTFWRRKHPELGVLLDHGAPFDPLRRVQRAGITREELVRRIRADAPIPTITGPEREALRRALANRKDL